MLALALVVLLCSCHDFAAGFSFLGNIEMPSIKGFQRQLAGGDKFAGKKVCVITGTSSGLGKATFKALMEEGNNEWHVVCAVRDTDKMEVVAEMEEYNIKDYSIMKCDLNSFESTRAFADNLVTLLDDTPLSRLVCNAAVYQPSLAEPKWSEDGIEQQMQTNHLSHFLLISLLMPEMRKAQKARCIMVGSVTGNDNTVGGGGVYPIADLHELEGLERGGVNPVSMMDGRNFNGAKAYKDSKLAIMMTSNALHNRYHKATGIAFSSIYPGCIAESPLFREKRPWFRKYFPMFMKYITGGFVSESEAGYRLFQVITDPRCTRSGIYWGWNGGQRTGRGDALDNDGKISGAGGAGGGWDSIFENESSDKVSDPFLQQKLWELSSKVTGAEWPLARANKSPCPTLRVIAAATAIVEKIEDNRNNRPPSSGQGGGERKAPQSMGELVGDLAF